MKIADVPAIKRTIFFQSNREQTAAPIINIGSADIIQVLSHRTISQEKLCYTQGSDGEKETMAFHICLLSYPFKLILVCFIVLVLCIILIQDVNNDIAFC